MKRSLTVQRVEIIRRGLEDFINTLLSYPGTAGDSSVCAFLEIPPVAALHGLVSPVEVKVSCCMMQLRVSAKASQGSFLPNLGNHVLGVQGVRDDPTYSPQNAALSTQQVPQVLTASNIPSSSAEDLQRAFETVGMHDAGVQNQQQQLAPPEPRSVTPPSRSQPKTSFRVPPPQSQFSMQDTSAREVETSTPASMSPSFLSVNERPPTPPQQMTMQEAYPPPTPPQPLDIIPTRLPSSLVPQVEQVDPGTLNISKREFKELFGQSPPASGDQSATPCLFLVLDTDDFSLCFHLAIQRSHTRQFHAHGDVTRKACLRSIAISKLQTGASCE